MQPQHLRRRQLRRTLNATDPTASIIVPAETMFVFNGSSADLAQQFYQRYQAGDALAKLAIPHKKLPERVRARLAQYDLQFKHLHSLLQRALLWDTGYVFDGAKLVQIWTANGTTMADIGLSYEDFAGTAGCSSLTCSSPATTAAKSQAYRSSGACDGAKLAPVLRCAVDSSVDSSTIGKDGVAFWATGGDAKAIPELSLAHHTWQDAETQQTFSVSAIHSITMSKESAVDCSSAAGANGRGHYSSLIIPCARFTSSNSSGTTTWAEPAHGKLVSVWLEHARADKPGFNTYYTVLIVVGALVGLVLLLVLCCKGKSRFKRRRQRREEAKMTSADPQALLESSDDALEVSAVALTPVHAILESDLESSTNSDEWKNVFVSSKVVAGRRLRMDQLALKQVIAHGAHGSEVWSAKYHGARVAVKRKVALATADTTNGHSSSSRNGDKSPQPAMTATPPTISAEIELLAALRHRNLVRFFGVAWDSPDSLCVITEYARKGSVESLLHRQRHCDNDEDDASAAAQVITWTQIQHIMVGVANALQYLHSRESPVVHGDLRARNVLLSSHWEAKVIGVRGSSAVATAADAGVLVPTLEDDVCALGVLFSELIALADRLDAACTTSEETKSSDDAPTSSVCPRVLLDIVAQCMATDPSARPRVDDVVRVLHALPSSLAEVDEEE